MNEEDATGGSERRTPVRDLHVALEIPYIYNYTAECYRQQVELTLYHNIKKVHVRDKYRGL